MATATGPTAVQRATSEKRVTLRKLFDSQKPELSLLLPKGMSAERLCRLALTEIVKNPVLLDCSAESWALAMQVCAAQGLYPDSGLGYMYLIPRGGKVTALRGYQGDIALARKSGEVLDIYAEVVYSKDTYKVTKGLERNIVHEPYDGDEDPGPLKAAYAVAKLRGGETSWVSLTKRDVERHKKSAQGTERPDSPWKAHEAQMWKKSAIRELFRWLPKATEELERVFRDEPDPGKTIDISSVTVPLEDKKGLERLTEQLADATEGAAAGCSHPTVPPSKVAATPVGKTVVCGDCGQEFPGEAERQPGEDDGPGPEEAVKAVAAAAEKTKQGRLG